MLQTDPLASIDPHSNLSAAGDFSPPKSAQERWKRPVIPMVGRSKLRAYRTQKGK